MTGNVASPVLTTDRLVLRPARDADFPAYRDYRRSARSTVPEGDEGMIWTHFAAFPGHWALRGFGRFVIEERATGMAIGHAGPFRPAGWPEGELTWTLWSQAHEGKGLAFEAAEAARDHAFRDLGWTTAVSYIAATNLRSIRLAERLGAVRDPAAQAPCGHDTVVFRHTRPEGCA